MGNFAVSRAFPAGVGLIERRRGAVLAWGFALLLIQLLPRLLMALHGGGDLQSLAGAQMDAVGHMPQAGAGPEAWRTWAASMEGGQAGMKGVGLLHLILFGLWTAFGMAVVHNAIFRAVLRPADTGFAGLRIGPAEFWQFLVKVAVFVLAAVALGAGSVLVVIIVSMAKAMPQPWGGWIAYLTLIGAIALGVWVSLRLSMSGPMTLAEGKFRLFESWAFTKGRAWKLFWTMLLPTAMLLGLYVFVFMAVFALLIPISALTAATFSAVAPGMTLSAVGGMVVAGVALVLYLLVASFVAGCLQAISVAPFAAAYAEMSGRDD